MKRIAGRVTGAEPGQRVVLFAKSGTWWVQPSVANPFTLIQADGTWNATIHLGTEYTAMLVGPKYFPPDATDALPPIAGGIIAVKTVEGRVDLAAVAAPSAKTIQFSGYEWEILQTEGESAGVVHANRSSNVWTDSKGFLHLRIAREPNQWTCAEVILTRSLGYGSYSFTVQNTPRMEPSVILGLFVWDPLGAAEHHREIDVEIGQWGDPAGPNAQFAIQPYYLPKHLFRFSSLAPNLTHTFRWTPGRVAFQTTQQTSGGLHQVVEHVFTSGIPTAGGERVRMNLYLFGQSKIAQQKEVEVVVEKFTYGPLSN